MFRVGQKVVAVGNGMKRKPGDAAHNIPLGTVCTIREIDTRCLAAHGMATVRLVEYVNRVEQTCMGPWETGYRPDCFRPIVERKTDISVFKKMLTPKTENIDA